MMNFVGADGDGQPRVIRAGGISAAALRRAGPKRGAADEGGAASEAAAGEERSTATLARSQQRPGIDLEL